VTLPIGGLVEVPRRATPGPLRCISGPQYLVFHHCFKDLRMLTVLPLLLRDKFTVIFVTPLT